ncbi:MAG: ATP-dependent zinc metalloprotease FtsH [Firmicutes bacterium]|uniref:ATP-dependent zinc metalloprotease FtsH n=2 Tax=Candidatus Colimorpha enterica TaxID=3083063 RepID=A0AAE3K1K3_9BACT|nr:ATP-dependent zinc metalloprotease FtsH [Candidatus Colimorpha enterica]MCI5755639.1 ATP-dependent zinc metalloprotease FtsH [Candidatus Colimorpha enterica]
MKKNYKLAIFYTVLTVGIILSLWLMFRSINTADSIVYSDLVEMFTNKEVKSFEVDKNNRVVIAKKDGKVVQYQLRDFSIFYYDFSDMIKEQVADGTIEKYEYEPLAVTPWWAKALPTVAVMVVIALLWFYMMNQAAGGKGSKIASFGKSRAKLGSDEKRKVYFKDVAGADEEKEELTEIVDFLRTPAKYTKLGARIPHGVLLVGPPGTGKTLLAKAVAGESGVPFYSISGSDFVEMYVGVGASRVRDLFDTAKKNPASIIFIDEIDAVGRHRGAGLGGGHDEREQTLNQLLVEMDGFGSGDGVIVMAATNRPDILDPALLRPGRFDRQITVNYPDLKGREDILHVHAKGKPFENTVDFHKVAQTTVGFTGADLANLLNESALLAARKGKNLIGMDEIEDSYMKVIMGPKKKSKVRTEHDNRLTAFHEAGHAIAAYFSPGADPVKHITIIPAGSAGGVTVMVPERDVTYKSKNQMFDDIVVSLGGRVAEQLTMEDISSGASSDIRQATAVARNMVMKYGMSDRLGPILYGSEHSSDEVFLGRDFSTGKDYSEKTASEIDDEIRAIIDRAYKRCSEILEAHSDKLRKLAEYLVKAESVDGDQFRALMEGDPSFEELDAMVAEKKRKSEEENESRRKREEEERKKREEERARRDAEMHNRNVDGMSAFGQFQNRDDQNNKQG